MRLGMGRFGAQVELTALLACTGGWNHVAIGYPPDGTSDLLLNVVLICLRNVGHSVTFTSFGLAQCCQFRVEIGFNIHRPDHFGSL